MSGTLLSGKVTSLVDDCISDTIRRVVRGEKDHFRLIVREHRLMVRSYLGSQLHRADEVDDLAQDVFLTAFRQLDQFDHRASFAAWLRGIARNRLLMHFRSTGRRRAREAKFREEVTRIIESDLETTFVNETEYTIEGLLRCIGTLPDRMRRVVRAGLDGVKAATLAEEMGTSTGAIYNLQYRANALLRECVQKEVE